MILSVEGEGKGIKKKTYSLLKKIKKIIKKNQKNQLKSQEKIKNKKNLVHLFFKSFTPR